MSFLKQYSQLARVPSALHSDSSLKTPSLHSDLPPPLPLAPEPFGGNEGDERIQPNHIARLNNQPNSGEGNGGTGDPLSVAAGDTQGLQSRGGGRAGNGTQAKRKDKTIFQDEVRRLLGENLRKQIAQLQEGLSEEEEEEEEVKELCRRVVPAKTKARQREELISAKRRAKVMRKIAAQVERVVKREQEIETLQAEIESLRKRKERRLTQQMEKREAQTERLGDALTELMGEEEEEEEEGVVGELFAALGKEIDGIIKRETSNFRARSALKVEEDMEELREEAEREEREEKEEREKERAAVVESINSGRGLPKEQSLVEKIEKVFKGCELVLRV